MFKDRLVHSGIAFAAGVAVLHQLPQLLPAYSYLFLVVVFGLWWWRPWLAPVCVFIIGFLWAMLCAQLRLANELPQELISKDLIATGVVISIPEKNQQRVRFEFQIQEQKSRTDGITLKTPVTARLSWYKVKGSQVPDLRIGQKWRLCIRLKPPIGFMNPGGFDYEGWLFSHNIRATGYIREHSENQMMATPSLRYFPSIIRADLLNRLSDATKELRHRGILLALAVGYRGHIEEQDWDLLRNTGTNHLMAISGLHIGLIAGMFYWLGLICVRFLQRSAWTTQALWPAQRIAAIIAWLAACCYAFMAGFSLPTQRALIMLSVGLFALVAYRQVKPMQAMVVALGAVLILDPFAVNAAGFWLSFGAVAVLLYSYAGRSSVSRLPKWMGFIAKWGKVQAVLLVGLLPLTIYWFGGAAVTATVANLVAIPLVGLVVVPMVLLASVCSGVSSGIAETLLSLADSCLALLWPVLEFLQRLPLARWDQAQAPLWMIVFALVGAVLLLAPRGLPARWTGMFWFLPMLWFTPERPEYGQLYLSVLDVGQGSAVVIQTQNHNLIYDAGPKFNDSFDAGKLVVLPYLKANNIASIDSLLISHSGNDHIGGSGAIIDNLPVSQVLSSAPDRYFKKPVDRCLKGRNWSWDGVDFSILHPDLSQAWEGNNSSCVLLIEVGSKRILLTGDIEKQAERHLLQHIDLAELDILLVPHHGSRTSSTKAFVNAIHPKHAIFSAGLHNRYGFPRPEIVARYTALGSLQWLTAEQGAIEFLVSSDGVKLRRLYRESGRRYWHY